MTELEAWLQQLFRRRRAGSARIVAAWCERDYDGWTLVRAQWAGGGRGGRYSVVSTEGYLAIDPNGGFP